MLVLDARTAQIAGCAALLPTTWWTGKFQADAPVRKWVSDFTYIWTAETGCT